jgi:transcriptional regulator with XRE-family HTH domain
MMATTDLGWLLEARRALGLTQAGLAEVLGTSLRTVQRMHAGRSSPSREQFGRLVQAIYPVNPDLAAGIAAWSGVTLERRDVTPAASLPDPLPSASAPPAVAEHAIDSVLCAAGDAVELPLSTVRAILAAAFVRAKELGLSMEAAAEALTDGRQALGSYPPEAEQEASHAQSRQKP